MAPSRSEYRDRMRQCARLTSYLLVFPRQTCLPTIIVTDRWVKDEDPATKEQLAHRQFGKCYFIFSSKKPFSNRGRRFYRDDFQSKSSTYLLQNLCEALIHARNVPNSQDWSS